jgi:hypothetical protein
MWAALWVLSGVSSRSSERCDSLMTRCQWRTGAVLAAHPYHRGVLACVRYSRGRVRHPSNPHRTSFTRDLSPQNGPPAHQRSLYKAHPKKLPHTIVVSAPNARTKGSMIALIIAIPSNRWLRLKQPGLTADIKCGRSESVARSRIRLKVSRSLGAVASGFVEPKIQPGKHGRWPSDPEDVRR